MTPSVPGNAVVHRANPSPPRSQIYYWKCDRPAAFFGTQQRENSSHSELETALEKAFSRRFPNAKLSITPSLGQGNHLTFVACIDEIERFIRIEDGPERDDYMDVESHILGIVHLAGVPTPKCYAVDASRFETRFAWQVLERIPYRDLNYLYKENRLRLEKIAAQIGLYIARWQSIQPEQFGPFNPEILRKENRLQGFHSSYQNYFNLHLHRHVEFLVESRFLTKAEGIEILQAMESYHSLLSIQQGCLVHKDLALWNILGDEQTISAVIDWDDAISGDAMDDLSLLGCFHGGTFLRGVLEGYASERALPDDYRERFWLHLLRNMLVKAVIRVGAGYFDRKDSFFLLNTAQSGNDLRHFTLRRLKLALRGLKERRDVSELED